MTPPSLTVAREILAHAATESREDVAQAIRVVLDHVAAREATDQSIHGAASVINVGNIPGVRSIQSGEDAREVFGRRDGDAVWDAFGRAPAPVVVQIPRGGPATQPSPGHALARCIACGKQAVLVEPDGGLPPWQCSACEIKAEQSEQARRAAIREHASAAGLSDTWVRLQIDRGTPIEEAREGAVRSEQSAAATTHGTAIPPEALVAEMLPCPICRSTSLTVGVRSESSFPGVMCGECGTRGPLARSTDNREAIANWNRRPQPRVESGHLDPSGRWVAGDTPLGRATDPPLGIRVRVTTGEHAGFVGTVQPRGDDDPPGWCRVQRYLSTETRLFPTASLAPV